MKYRRQTVGFHGKPSSTPAQLKFLLEMIRKSEVDGRRYENIWTTRVHALKDVYLANE